MTLSNPCNRYNRYVTCTRPARMQHALGSCCVLATSEREIESCLCSILKVTIQQEVRRMSDFVIELCRILLATVNILAIIVVLTLQFRVIGLPRVLDTRKTPHHMSSRKTRYLFIYLSYVEVRHPNPRPRLGGNVTGHETPQRIRGLENDTTATHTSTSS